MKLGWYYTCRHLACVDSCTPLVVLAYGLLEKWQEIAYCRVESAMIIPSEMRPHASTHCSNNNGRLANYRTCIALYIHVAAITSMANELMILQIRVCRMQDYK